MVIKKRWLTGLLLLLVPAWPGAAPAAQLRLTWTDNSYDEAGFQIERRMGTTGTLTPIITVGMNITAYVDPTVTAGTHTVIKCVPLTRMAPRLRRMWSAAKGNNILSLRLAGRSWDEDSQALRRRKVLLQPSWEGGERRLTPPT
jgi:hypothetical protein